MVVTVVPSNSSLLIPITWSTLEPELLCCPPCLIEVIQALAPQRPVFIDGKGRHPSGADHDHFEFALLIDR
jgi:hypothetical protein